MPQTITEDDRQKLLEKGAAQYLGAPGPSPEGSPIDYQDVINKGVAQYLTSDPLTPGPTTPPVIGAPSPSPEAPEEKPGLLSRAFSATFSPPEFVQKEAKRAGEATIARATSEGIGGGQPPPATILKDGKHVDNPDFARYMHGARKAGLSAGAIETGAGFLSPGVIALTLLSGGTSVLGTRGIKSAQVLMKAIKSGKASPAQVKQFVDVYNKAGKSAEFWQNANKIVHTSVGAGFTAHGGSKAIEAIQEEDSTKLALAIAEMMIGVGGGGASFLRPAQPFPGVDYGGPKPPLKSGAPRGEAGPARPTLEQQRQRLGLGKPPKPKEAVIELTAEELSAAKGPGATPRGKLQSTEKPGAPSGLGKPPALVEGLKPSAEGLTPEGSGTSVLSNEELTRNENFYRVDRSGNLTFQGKQPDPAAPLKPGEAVVAIDVDGNIRTAAGDMAVPGKVDLSGLQRPKLSEPPEPVDIDVSDTATGDVEMDALVQQMQGEVSAAREKALDQADYYAREARRLKALQDQVINEGEKTRIQGEIDYNLERADAYRLQAEDAAEVYRKGLTPPPAPPALSTPTDVKPRAFPGRPKFDPDNTKLDHSLYDYVISQGFKKRKGQDYPAPLLEQLATSTDPSGKRAASRLYHKDGIEPDILMRLAREEGQFELRDIPEDMNTEDFLALISGDYVAKKSPNEGIGKRIYSRGRGDPSEGIEDEFQTYAKARQKEIKAEAAQEKTPEITETDQPDIEGFEFGPSMGEPYKAILKDGTEVEIGNALSAKEAREFAELNHPGQVESVHPLITPPPKPPKKPGEKGYIDFGGIIESFFPKKRDHSAVESDPAYQDLLATRRLRAAGPTFWNRQRQFWVDLPLDTARRFLNKHYDLERLVGTSLENAEARAAAGELQAIVALEGFQDPRYAVDIAVGGTVPKMQVAQIELNEIRRIALAHDLQDEFTYFLEHTAWQRNFKIIEEKKAEAFKQAGDALHAGDLELAKKWRGRYEEYKRRLREGEVVPAGKTLEDVQRDLETFTSSATLAPSDLELLQSLSDRFFQDNGRYWKLLFDEELLSETVYKQGLVRGPEYLPMNRIHEKFTDDPDFGGLSHLNAAVRKSLKRFEGSSLASLDPFEAAFIWRTRAISDASRNRAMRLIFRSRELDPDGLGQYIVPLANAQRPEADYTKFSFYSKGNKKSFALPNLVAAGLSSATPRDITMVNWVLRAGQAGLHAGAIGYNLGFALPNVARDIGRTVLLSKVVEPLSRETPKDLARYAMSWGKALRHVIRQDPQYQDFLWSGAAGGTLARNITPMNWVIPPWVKNKGAYRLANVPGRVINTIPAIVNALEETSKMAAYVSLREKGFSEVDAAIEARRYAGTPDSKRKGYDGDTLNMAVMFWNVRQQGRLFAVKRFYKEPKRILQALIAAAIPALVLYKWNASFRDKDGKPEIAHVPRHERRDNFIWFSSEVNPETGRYLYYKMPIPHEMKWAWIPMNDVLNDTSGEMDVKMSQYVQGIASAAAETFPLVPNLDIQAMEMGRSAPLEFARGASAGLNPVIGLPLEQLANLDFFRDVPIESRAQQNLAPEERFGPHTSETAVVVGRAMPEWMGPMRSPKRLEHAVRSFGGGAEMALELVDPLSKHWSPQPKLPPRPGASQVPVIGGSLDVIKRRFVGGGYRDQVVEDYETLFYHYYAESAEIIATFNQLKTTPERAKEWMKEKPERATLYNLQGYIREVRQRLKLFADQRWNLQYLLNMSEEERSQRLLKNTEDSASVLEAAQIIQRLVEEARSGGEEPLELTPPPAQ